MRVREILDVHGRRYRVGESDRELLGRPRAWTAWLTGAAMLVTGAAQYGFGALVPALADHFSLTELAWAFALWTAFQAGTAFPAARLRDRGRLRPARAMVTGALLAAVGLLTLGHADSGLTLYLGYSVIGGIGTGLVYATCVGTVIRWFPDRTTSRIARITAAFALGGVPFALAATTLIEDRATFLNAAAIVVLTTVTACGLPLGDPPRNWWPADQDPRKRARTHHTNRPAIRHFAPREALRSGVVVPMVLTVFAAAAVSLFDLAFIALFGTITALCALALAAGVGRLLAAPISDRYGRRRTMRLAMAVGGVAQLVLLVGIHREEPTTTLIGAALAGLGTSTCYALLVGLVREYFGEDTAPLNFAVIYSAKAAGGVLGVGVASMIVVSQGYPVVFVAAAALGVGGALLGGVLSRPGLPKQLLPKAAP